MLSLMHILHQQVKYAIGINYLLVYYASHVSAKSCRSSASQGEIQISIAFFLSDTEDTVQLNKCIDFMYICIYKFINRVY